MAAAAAAASTRRQLTISAGHTWPPCSGQDTLHRILYDNRSSISYTEACTDTWRHTNSTPEMKSVLHSLPPNHLFLSVPMSVLLNLAFTLLSFISVHFF